MTTPPDNGFTLVEVLVGLLVLSFTAIVMSSTMGNAFSNFAHVRSVSHDYQAQREFQSVLDTLGREEIFRQISGNELSKKVDFSSGVRLAIENGNRAILTDKWGQTFMVYESNRIIDLRLSGGQASRQILTVYTGSDDEERIIAQAILIANVDVNCRYDIVGRRCR